MLITTKRAQSEHGCGTRFTEPDPGSHDARCGMARQATIHNEKASF